MGVETVSNLVMLEFGAVFGRSRCNGCLRQSWQQGSEGNTPALALRSRKNWPMNCPPQTPTRELTYLLINEQTIALVSLVHWFAPLVLTFDRMVSAVRLGTFFYFAS
eukprot:6196108-Pleurochrysis_carterae.AAC.3